MATATTRITAGQPLVSCLPNIHRVLPSCLVPYDLQLIILALPLNILPVGYLRVPVRNLSLARTASTTCQHFPAQISVVCVPQTVRFIKVFQIRTYTFLMRVSILDGAMRTPFEIAEARFSVRRPPPPPTENHTIIPSIFCSRHTAAAHAVHTQQPVSRGQNRSLGSLLCSAGLVFFMLCDHFVCMYRLQ